MSSSSETNPDRESVWDYPRPPAVDPTDRTIRVVFNDRTIAHTTDAIRILETSHPPVYYIPPSDVATGHLVQEERTTLCEFKGRAVYYTIRVDDRSVPHAAWVYPTPSEEYAAIAGHFAFYPSKVDRCTVDDDAARPQDGDFYGGWITDEIVGPFKGAPGTMEW